MERRNTGKPHSCLETAVSRYAQCSLEGHDAKGTRGQDKTTGAATVKCASVLFLGCSHARAAVLEDEIYISTG
jgi:hypothetical protein